MTEYIEREAAIKAIYESDHFSVRECFGWSAREIEEVLRAVPATDVAPVRHGRLVMSSDRPDTIICTCCDSAFDVWKADIKRHHYCPNCGARMDGAE